MKKITLLCLMPILLAGCGKDPAPATGSGAYKKWSYYVPVQAPAVAMAHFASLEKFETTTEPSSISPLMVAGQYDVVVAPTNVGVAAMKTGNAPYKLLATITFGNFYLASTGKDEDTLIGTDDYIVSFQPPGIPDKVLHYCYGTSLNSAIHYVSNNLVAQTCLETGVNSGDGNADVEYVLIAEPSLTIAMTNNSNVKIRENLQETYYNLSGGSIITQASVFVKNTLKSKDIKEEFLPLLKSSIEKFISKPSELKKTMQKVDSTQTIFGVTPEVAEKATKNRNRMGLGIKESKTIMEDTNKFLEMIGAPQISNEDLA